jgi:hypothetical protein
MAVTLPLRNGEREEKTPAEGDIAERFSSIAARKK